MISGWERSNNVDMDMLEPFAWGGDGIDWSFRVSSYFCFLTRLTRFDEVSDVGIHKLPVVAVLDQFRGALFAWVG
jgi:hypothetical protein